MLQKLKEKSISYYYSFNSFCRQNPDLPVCQNLNNLTPYANTLKERLNKIQSAETRRKMYYVFSLLLKWSGNEKKAKEFSQESIAIGRKLNEFLLHNLPRSSQEAECINISFAQIRNENPVVPNKNKRNMNPKRLLFNLLIHPNQTPRLEYRLLQYSPTKKKKDKNYIEFDKKRKIYKMVINLYKTAETYGPWQFDLDQSLSEYIHNFIEYHSVKSNHNFFKTNRNNIYESNKFSKYVKQMFKWILGTPITINCLRKIKEKALYHQNPQMMNLSLAQKEQWLIDTFRHNMKTAQLYYNPLKNAAPVSRNVSEISKNPMITHLPPHPPPPPTFEGVPQSNEQNIKTFLTELHQTMNKYNISYRLLRQLICKDLLI